MLRVLMVLEDYGELMFLQTVLKKLGFDVDAIQNPRSFSDSILRMNPDVLVLTANGKKVKGYDMIRNIRRVRGLPRVILLRAANAPEIADPHVDGWIESPVSALALLEMIADIAGLNKQVLSDKFQKMRMQGEIEGFKERPLRPDEETEEETLERSKGQVGNFGVMQNSTMPDEEREERYKKFLNEKTPSEYRFTSKQVADHVKALRAEEQETDLEELEKQRKAFVEHLFNKKSGS